jgi:hypothetical protein
MWRQPGRWWEEKCKDVHGQSESRQQSGSWKTSVVRVLVVPPSDVPGQEMASGCCKLWSCSHNVALHLPQGSSFSRAQAKRVQLTLRPKARCARVCSATISVQPLNRRHRLHVTIQDSIFGASCLSRSHIGQGIYYLVNSLTHTMTSHTWTMLTPCAP